MVIINFLITSFVTIARFPIGIISLGVCLYLLFLTWRSMISDK